MAAADCQGEKQIANDIKEEFCRRVIPSDLIRHLQCFTKDDIEKVLDDEEKHGPMHAAAVLLKRLIQQSDWLSHLKIALLNPDAGLLDFGERIELMCRKDDDDGDSISDDDYGKDDDDGDSISDDDYAPELPNRGYGPSTNRIKHIIIHKKPTITHSPQNPPPPPPPPNHPI